ncbi:MAG: OmpH family outer membrane protein [Myxococcus sp.]|nr:OmpH family outer membrane protein [Myxococcus sp.]
MRRFALLTLCLATVARAEFKAAYVDFQRALVEVEEGRAARQRLQVKADARKKELEGEKVSLEQEAEVFKKQEATMDDKARRTRVEGLMKRQQDLADKVQKAQVEISDAERKEMATILPKFEAILGEIAQREGLSMVFDRASSGLAWAPPYLDLTNELIRTYNARKAGAAKGADAPKAADAAKPKAGGAPTK